jgi:hypothetical protein
MLAQHAQPRPVRLPHIHFPRRPTLLVAGVAVIAVAAVVGWTVADRITETPTERLALNVAHFWSANDTRIVSDLYASQVTYIAIDGTERTGIAGILSASAASAAAGVRVEVAGPAIENGRYIAVPMTHRSGTGQRAVMTVLEVDAHRQIVRHQDFGRPLAPPRSWHMGMVAPAE